MGKRRSRFMRGKLGFGFIGYSGAPAFDIMVRFHWFTKDGARGWANGLFDIRSARDITGDTGDSQKPKRATDGNVKQYTT